MTGPASHTLGSGPSRDPDREWGHRDSDSLTTTIRRAIRSSRVQNDGRRHGRDLSLTEEIRRNIAAQGALGNERI